MKCSYNKTVKDKMEETTAKGALFKMASSPEKGKPGGELKLLEALSLNNGYQWQLCTSIQMFFLCCGLLMNFTKHQQHTV